MPVHHVLDIGMWMARFDLATLRDRRESEVLAEFESGRAGYSSRSMLKQHLRNAAPRGEPVVGPGQIAVIEQLRREAPVFDLPTVPTDVFVWAQGTAPDRAMTSVGQVPYWPRTMPWPTDDGGNVMACVGQLSFVDSTDIVGGLPGEILVAFVRMTEAGAADMYHPTLFWVDRRDGPPLDIAPDSGILAVRPAYGVRYRTFDVQSAGTHFPREDITRVSIIEGTKAGGLPRWIQGRPTHVAGRFIGAMGSVVPDPWEPYPMLNVPSPEGLVGAADMDLSWLDMGSALLFEDKGATTAIVQGY